MMPHRKQAASQAVSQRGTIGAQFNKHVNQYKGLECEYIPDSESEEESEGSRNTIEDVEAAASEMDVAVKEAMSKLFELFCPQSPC